MMETRTRSQTVESQCTQNTEKSLGVGQHRFEPITQGGNTGGKSEYESELLFTPEPGAVGMDRDR